MHTNPTTARWLLTTFWYKKSLVAALWSYVCYKMVVYALRAALRILPKRGARGLLSTSTRGFLAR